MYITLARNLDNIRSYQHHTAIRSILRWTVDSNTVGIFVQQRDNKFSGHDHDDDVPSC